MTDETKEPTALDAINNAVEKANGNAATCTLTFEVSWNEHGVQHAAPSTNGFEENENIPGAVKMFVADLLVQSASIIFQLGERQAAGHRRSGLVVPGHRGPIRGLN